MRQTRILILTYLLIFFSVSCIDRDVLNVSDSLEIHSSYSVPIGSFVYDINEYLESLAGVTNPSADSLYFEDVLYPSGVSSVNFSSLDSINFNVVRDPSGKVKSIEFVILITNGYPTEIAAQVYFLTGTSLAPADSVFASGPVTIQPAKIDGEGRVTDPSSVLYNVTMPTEFIQKLSLIAGILVKGRVNVTRPDVHWVKFYHHYQINLHIGSRIEMLFNTNGL
jgi:hypothetical protein